MQRLNIGLAAAVAVAGLAVLPAGALAAQPALDFNGSLSGTHQAGINTGTYTASGAVSGSFAVSESFSFGGGKSAPLHTVDTLTPLTGSDGTITIDQQLKYIGSSGSCSYFSGVWMITGGTGAYASVHGTGDAAGTVCPSGDSYTVAVSLIGAGG